MTIFARVCGAILVALVAVPVYRILYGREIGLIGTDILTFTEQDRTLLMMGAPIVLVIGLLVARVAGGEKLERAGHGIARRLTSIPVGWFALMIGSFAAMYAAGFSLWVLDGKPNLIDAMAQLLHARFVASGQLAGPVNEWNEFWYVQNSLVTPHGWVSQYPPGHVLLLAAGFRAGAAWAVGPLLCGVAVFFTALAAERLLSEDRAVARIGAVLAASSSFFVAHAGAYMNHTSAAALGAAAVYFAVRARDEAGVMWAIFAGAATGAAFATRPLAALVTAAVVAVVFASSSSRGRPSLLSWLRASLVAGTAALPFAAAIAAYNARFFGAPLRFGYTAAWGPSTGLGFQRDPWGNVYGFMEAIGFTSSDLTALSLHLLGTPIPIVVVAGLFLLQARRLSTGERLIALWALLPVAANALYWHHGMFMGPRMLNEAAPAWALLSAVAAAGLLRRVPQSWEARGYSARGALACAFGVAAATGIFYLGPDRLLQYGGAWQVSTRIEVPALSQPSLVFVHGGWTSRIAARLAVHGLRLDSLESALRRNPTCDVHHFANEYAEQRRLTDVAQPLDFTLRPASLPRIYISQGNWVLHRDGHIPPDCLRQIAADTLGTVDIAPLIWRSDLPGAPRDGALIVRDMGPEANATLIAAHPDRVPLMFMRRADDVAPVLVPYESGVSTLWPR